MIAVDAVNKPQAFMMGKRLIMEKYDIDKDRLADEKVSIKEVMIR